MGEQAIEDMVVLEMFEAFFGQERAAIEALLSDDFTFTSPNDDHIDKATYFERCFPNSVEFEDHDIEDIFAKGDADYSAAFVRYVAELKDGKRFRNTEFHRFEHGKIKSVDVYFGASES